MTVTPDIIEVLRAIVQDETWRFRVCLPGVVESYDPLTQTVSVKPAVKIPRNDEETQRGYSYLDPPVISGVPVAFPQGGDGGYITWPIVKGASVLLVFADVSIDDWLIKGGSGVEPESTRRFDISDAVAIAGLSPITSPISGNTHAGMALEHPAEIKLGANALTGVGRADLIEGYLSTINTQLIGLGAPGLGVPPFLVGSAKVKVE